MAADEQTATTQPTPALGDLPLEVFDRIASLLPPRDLASLNATARIFHAAPPGGCSPVESALRERARARGHDRALPASLPSGVRTWAAELLVRERVLELASSHASPISAGNNFSAFVDAEGGLHTCGEAEVWDDDDGPTDEFRPHVATGHSDEWAVLVPTRVASLGVVRVVAVAAGYDHLLALSDAGAVYGCGKNSAGQLGLGDTKERWSFRLVAALADAVLAGIAAGRNHSFALTAAGGAYSWGSNRDGQLGHGDWKARWEPTRIEALDGVRVGGVGAGGMHTLFLSAHGAVYSCGCGYSGQLGHGGCQEQHTPRSVAVPRRIEALAGVRAVHVSAGYDHSLVVDQEGGLHLFGRGRSNGHDRHTPRRLEALAGVRAVRACACSGDSSVLGADGSVHTFARHEVDGLLGLRPDGGAAAEARTRVFDTSHIRMVRCAMGDSHTLYVRADGSVYSCGVRSAALGLGMAAGDDVQAMAMLEISAQRVVDLTRVETAWRARAC